MPYFPKKGLEATRKEGERVRKNGLFGVLNGNKGIFFRKSASDRERGPKEKGDVGGALNLIKKE